MKQKGGSLPQLHEQQQLLSLITYQLERTHQSSGFGFDLKGDRPAVIGPVRKGTLAESVGLEEGDLVISINNMNVTDLDHDEIVSLVSQCKSKLVIQVTKTGGRMNVGDDGGMVLASTSKSSKKSSSNKLLIANSKQSSQSKRTSSHKRHARRDKDYINNLTYTSQSTASSSSNIAMLTSYDDNLNSKNNTNTTASTTTSDEEEEAIGENEASVESEYENYYEIGIPEKNQINDAKQIKSKRRVVSGGAISAHQHNHHKHLYHHNHKHHKIHTKRSRSHHHPQMVLNPYPVNRKQQQQPESSAQYFAYPNYMTQPSKHPFKEYTIDQRLDYSSQNSANQEEDDDDDYEDVYQKFDFYNTTEDTEDTEDTEENIFAAAARRPATTMPATSNRKLNQKIAIKSSSSSGGKATAVSVSTSEQKIRYSSGKKASAQIKAAYELDGNNYYVMPMHGQPPRVSSALDNRNYYNESDLRKNVANMRLMKHVSSEKKSSGSRYPPTGLVNEPQYSTVKPTAMAKLDYNVARVANIKNFKSNTLDRLKSSSSSSSANNNCPSYVPSATRGPLHTLRLTSNDLFAILSPIIKPHLFAQNQYHAQAAQATVSCRLLYMGSIYIPYDTARDAAKLKSIRSSIEYFMKQRKENEVAGDNQRNNSLMEMRMTVNAETSIISTGSIGSTSSTGAGAYSASSSVPQVTMIVHQDRLQILDSRSSEMSKNTVYYGKDEIAFCGRIKESQQFFALVVFSSSSPSQSGSRLVKSSSLNSFQAHSSSSPTTSSSCLVFRYVSNNASNLDMLLNDISRLYADQNSVFNILPRLDANGMDEDEPGGMMKMMTMKPHAAANLNEYFHMSNSSNGVNNHNYDYLSPMINNNNNSKEKEQPHVETTPLSSNKKSSKKTAKNNFKVNDSSRKLRKKSPGLVIQQQKKNSGIKKKQTSSSNLKSSNNNESVVFSPSQSVDSGSNKIGEAGSHAGASKPQATSLFTNLFHLPGKKITTESSTATNNAAQPQQKSSAKRLLLNLINSIHPTDANAAGPSKLKSVAENSESFKTNSLKKLQPLQHQLLKQQSQQQRRLSDFHRPGKSLLSNDDENQANDNANKLNQTKVSLTNSLTDVHEDLINEKSNEIGRVTKWATGFERLLEDPIGLQIFTEFLKKEFSEENITFWVKCENFKKLTDPEEMRKESQEIWTNYLDTSSLHQINVDNKARSHCQEALQTPNNTMFEMAQSHIFSLMKYDSYSRFLKSQMYKDCIVNEMEGKPIYPNSVNKSVTSTGGKISKGGGKLGSQVNMINEEAVADSATLAKMGNNSNSNLSSTASSYSNSDKMHPPQSPLLNNSHILNTSNTIAGTLPYKRRSTILPWTKGKEKKAITEQSIKQTNLTPRNLNEAIAHMDNSQIGVEAANTSHLIKDLSNLEDLNEANLDTSATLSSHIESKYCRVLCNSDGSSTMIQAIPGQTVYQALSKIFVKKMIPCYKCDLYFVGDYQPINQQCDAHILGSKEICLVERSLFVLSLMPIAINLCVKANRKKSIITILQPILDCYQIKTNNCSIFLNSTGNLLNLNDPCSVVDNQHVVVVHKNQTTLLSTEEIEKFINVSVSDFIPVNINEFHFQFDELGILKQKINKTPAGSPTVQYSQQFNPKQHHTTSLNQEQGERYLIDLLKKAQDLSLDDQRGRLNSKHLEMPEFLLKNGMASTTTSQSHSDLVAASGSTGRGHRFQSSIYDTSLNKSSSSLPLNQPISAYTESLIMLEKREPPTTAHARTINSINSDQQSSSICIVYDYDVAEMNKNTGSADQPHTNGYYV